jgi:hypothetical protein
MVSPTPDSQGSADRGGRSGGDALGRLEVGPEGRSFLERLRGIGHEVVLTLDGHIVGRFVPEQDGDARSFDRALRRLQEFRASHTTGGIGWQAMRDEGRR